MSSDLYWGGCVGFRLTHPYRAQMNFIPSLIKHVSSCFLPAVGLGSLLAHLSSPGLTRGPVGLCVNSTLLVPSQAHRLETGTVPRSVSFSKLKHTICLNYRECDVSQIGTSDCFPKHYQIIYFSRAGKVCCIMSLLFKPCIYIVLHIL